MPCTMDPSKDKITQITRCGLSESQMHPGDLGFLAAGLAVLLSYDALACQQLGLHVASSLAIPYDSESLIPSVL
ncbi:hypothetical protein Tco_0718742 [Tanacetum coccineum]